MISCKWMTSRYFMFLEQPLWKYIGKKGWGSYVVLMWWFLYKDSWWQWRSHSNNIHYVHEITTKNNSNSFFTEYVATFGMHMVNAVTMNGAYCMPRMSILLLGLVVWCKSRSKWLLRLQDFLNVYEEEKGIAWQAHTLMQYTEQQLLINSLASLNELSPKLLSIWKYYSYDHVVCGTYRARLIPKCYGRLNYSSCALLKE